MNNVKNWFTKDKFIIFSILMLVVYVISYFSRVLELPVFFRDFCCADDKKLNLFLIFLPIIIFAFIFYRLSDRKFEKWKSYTFNYIIVYLIIYLLSPKQSSDFIWFQRETVSFLSTILYFITSLFFIFCNSKKD